MCCLAGAALLAPAAAGQAVVRAGGGVTVRFGFALQAWADFSQDPATGGTAQNLFIRRARLYVAGKVAPGVTFLIVPVASNVGKAPRTNSPFIEDGYLEWEVAGPLMLDGGLILVPFCRNCLEQSVRQLTLDFGSASFLATGVTQSVSGRDTGFQAKGYLLGDRLEYRAAVFQGRREGDSRNQFRGAGRLQYDFFGIERAQFYPGTYLGTKKVLAVGIGHDRQADYRAWAADIFLDLPVARGDGLTAQVDWVRWDGGETFPSLARQDNLFAEAGYYFGRAKLLPWVRYESQRFADEVNSGRDQRKAGAGVTWYAEGHAFNIRAAVTRVIPGAAALPCTTQVTVQVQLFTF